MAVRNLVIVLGDQLNRGSAAFDGFDPSADAVWMAEVAAEANHVPSHRARIALFLSAMRHFRDELKGQGIRVHYRTLDDPENRGSFETEIASSIRRLKPKRLRIVEPGEWRVREIFRRAARAEAAALDLLPDRHFFCSADEFEAYARDKKTLRLEYFYRELRRRHGILMEDGQPVGGRWNYDKANRQAFDSGGPKDLPQPISFSPDVITREVLRLVHRRFGNHPGSLARFDWPVTREQALQALDDFLEHRLPRFGEYQDAMWTSQPWLYHSRLSAALNLKLLDPREVVARAEQAYVQGAAPLPSVEGFIRQVLGWREYVRGIYWQHMPEYLERNALAAHEPLPSFFWSGNTEMNCLAAVIGQTLTYGYAHHIQRLMVTGLFAQLLGVNPLEVHEWYLAVYVDAVEWVEAPNTLGMSQYADDGLMSSKPYVASGRYIQRMSDYCKHCRYRPDRATGPDACPFTTLYWDFLERHRKRFRDDARMVFQLKNLERKPRDERRAIRRQATALKESIRSGDCTV